MSPIGHGFEQNYSVSDPPLSGGTVRLSFAAVGDFASVSEALQVSLNGTEIGTTLVDNGRDCPNTPDLAEIQLGRDLYNNLVVGGDAVFELVATAAVEPNPTQCMSFVSMRVDYQAISDGDCNGNGVPDACELSDEAGGDCNGNKVPDECEFPNATGLPASQEEGAELLELLTGCMTGPCFGETCTEPGSLPGCCNKVDFDSDGDVDLSDAAAFDSEFRLERP